MRLCEPEEARRTAPPLCKIKHILQGVHGRFREEETGTVNRRLRSKRSVAIGPKPEQQSAKDRKRERGKPRHAKTFYWGEHCFTFREATSKAAAAGAIGAYAVTCPLSRAGHRTL